MKTLRQGNVLRSSRRSVIVWATWLPAVLAGWLPTVLAVEDQFSIHTEGYRRTEHLGGADFPSGEQCAKMHALPYVLRARDGKMTQVAAEKSRLPFDPEFHPQGGLLYHAHDALIYARQTTVLSKTLDGGRTWTSWNIAAPRKNASDQWQVLRDGTFVRIVMSTGEAKTDPAQVYRSDDEGRTWHHLTEIPIVVPGGYQFRYAHWRMTKLPDETLFYCIDLHTDEPGPDRYLSSRVMLTGYRSTDGGESWQGPIKICDAAAEGGFAVLPSGRLLASVRYQRPFRGTDSEQVKAIVSDPRGFKNHFLLHSDDGGMTWKDLRPLTTVFGQCYGYPVAQSDGTVVVVHDTRYGPGPDAARAMVSYDAGKTWEDEVYYLYYEKGQTSYSQSVVLADDTILTLGGSSDNPEARRAWPAAIGSSHLTAIRWKPVKSGKWSTAAAEEMSPAKAARRKALGRRRRIIFNDDTYELSRADANTPAGMLRRRLQPLVGTHVDTISWSVLGGWADAPVYDSKLQPIYGDAHGGPVPSWTAVTRNVKAMIQAGACPLRATIDFAHANEMELFASIRMNDCHDSFIAGGVTIWKKEHPEFLVDSAGVVADRTKHTKGLYVTAQDFSHQEVRDRKFEIIEEVCQRFDIDGIDLNYMRHPVFFSETMKGIAVSADQVRIMTDLMVRIRKLTDEVGQQRGRPILVAAIVPDNPQLALNVGLDVENWIREDLIDIVIPGLGYAPLTLPVKQYVDLARDHGVHVYPCINRKAPQNVADSLLSDGFRGVASNWFRQGADGLFFWNLGTPFEFQTGEELKFIRGRYYETLTHLGDPRQMVYRDKIFGTDGPVLSYYTHISSRPTVPLPLPPGTTAWLDVAVADDVQAAIKAGKVKAIQLKTRWAGEGDVGQVRMWLGGEPLNDVERTAEKSTSCSVPPQSVVQGVNRLAVSLPDAETAGSLQLKEVRLWLRYNQ